MKIESMDCEDHPSQIVCATEPDDRGGKDHLAPFELPDDENDELLTVDLSPAAGRKRSKSNGHRNERQLVNQKSAAVIPPGK